MEITEWSQLELQLKILKNVNSWQSLKESRGVAKTPAPQTTTYPLMNS